MLVWLDVSTGTSRDIIPKLVKIKYVWIHSKLIFILRCWFKIVNCFTSKSYDILVYYLIFKWCLKSSTLYISTIWQRLHISGIKLKIRAFFYYVAYHPNIYEWWFHIYVFIDNFLPRGKHVHDLIIELKSWVHKLALHVLLKCLHKVGNVSCHVGIEFVPFYIIILFFLNSSDFEVFLFFILLFNTMDH